MPLYRVHVELIEDYDDIEADNEEDACIIASDYAIKGGSWYMNAEEINEGENNE